MFGENQVRQGQGSATWTVAINRLTSPPSAKATFNVFVTGADRHGEFGEQSRPAKVVLSLDHEGGRWLITGHKVKINPHDL